VNESEAHIGRDYTEVGRSLHVHVYCRQSDSAVCKIRCVFIVFLVFVYLFQFV